MKEQNNLKVSLLSGSAEKKKLRMNADKKKRGGTLREPRAPLLIISTVIKTVTISLSSQNSLTVGAFNFVKISSSLAL